MVTLNGFLMKNAGSVCETEECWDLCEIESGQNTVVRSLCTSSARIQLVSGGCRNIQFSMQLLTLTKCDMSVRTVLFAKLLLFLLPW